MQNITELMEKVVHEKTLIYAVFSNVRNKSEKTFNKVIIKKVIKKNEVKHQFEYVYEKKVTHENLDGPEAINQMCNLMENYFRQGVINCIDADYQVLVSKKGKIKILKKSPSRQIEDMSHNRKKNYILAEGERHPFLIELGIMTPDGKVINSKYDKYRQINRYLELVSDCIPYLNKKEKVRIIDFGCGKAYLTFALYEYLVTKLDYDVEIVGLDLKEDVIKFCNNLAQKLEYKDLRFVQGDIKGFNEFDDVDMVISLHACDTATDDALARAVAWGSKVILAVPCCQHELNKKIHNRAMQPLLKHGILKERVSSLVTDALRATVLEIMGYTTQVIEFVDMEHTPKNLMIRCFWDDIPVKRSTVNQYEDYKSTWHIEPYIEEAFGKKLKDRLKEGQTSGFEEAKI